MINCVYRFAIFVSAILVIVAPSPAADISGTYVENGMTVRASSGLPSSHVSLCGLLSRDFDPAAHKTLARDDRTIRVTLHEDLLLEVFISGGLPGSCTVARTKSDGLRLGTDGVTFVLKSKKWEAKYRLERGIEGRLLVFIDAKHSSGGQRLQGEYAFPRVSSVLGSVK